MPEEWITASAPGRVNLIGEHTDYHDGFVLPTVLPQRTSASVRVRSDGNVHARSDAIADAVESFRVGAERPGRGWLDYVQGITVALAARGLPVGGFDVRLTSTVPVGAGLSSSAALEVSVLRALRTAFALPLDDVELAQTARAVETDFVGAPIGIMDQMASSVGRDGEALFLDTRTLQFERLPLPAADLIVIDSGVAHQHAGGAYVTRRQESFEAAARLGVDRLRDVGIEALLRIEELPPVLRRRARHIVTENDRVQQAVAALRRGDAPALGRLFDASHASMRDDYEVSTAEVDTLVRLGQEHAAIYGARLTGGGFGGAVVMLAAAGEGIAAAVEIRTRYHSLTARDAIIVMPRPCRPE